MVQTAKAVSDNSKPLPSYGTLLRMYQKMVKLLSVSLLYTEDEASGEVARVISQLLEEPLKETERTVYSENELTGSRKTNNLQEPKTSGTINRNQNTEGENEMPRARKTPAAAATPAPTQQPAANPFGAAAGTAPAGQPPNPVFGGAGQSPAPTPNAFGGAPVQQPAANPAGGMFGAAQAAHPTQNPAAPAASVDLTPVLQAIEAFKKEALQQVNAAIQDIRSVHTRLQTVEGKLVTPQAQSAATPSAPAQASPPAQAATATPQANGFPPDQVAHVVTYIRQGLQGHYASGGVPINVNNPEHQTMLTNAAVSAGTPYLQGADASNENLKQHIVQSLQAAGAVDAAGNVVA